MSSTLKIFLSSLLFVFLFFTGCSNDDAVTPSKPVILELNSMKLYTGDTVTIYGKNFSNKTDASFICIGDTVIIQANECLKWNNSMISFRLPAIDYTDTHIIVVVGSDSSNAVNVIYRRYREIDAVVINGGVFTMGSSTGYADESPIHNVVLPYNLYVSKYEVTRLFWESVYPSATWLEGNLSLPKVDVSWLEAIEFCNKVSEYEGLDKCYEINGDEVVCHISATGWRLPTEAEWEYICRAGNNGDYPGEPGDLGWFDVNSGYALKSVGMKSPNSNGLYDILGNAYEWCFDTYDSNYYEIAPESKPLNSAPGIYKVIRGGAFDSAVFLLRSAARAKSSVAADKIGFRLVKYHGPFL